MQRICIMHAKKSIVRRRKKRCLFACWATKHQHGNPKRTRHAAAFNGSSKLLASHGSVAPKLQIPSTAANGCSTCNCDRLGIPSSAPPIVVMHVAACRYPIVRNFRSDQRGQFPVRLMFDLASVRLRRAINQMWRVFKTNQPYS